MGRSGLKGVLIAFEGGEGCGKSTQSGRLARWLRREGLRPLVTRQPGGTRVGNQIRDVLLNPYTKKMSELAEVLLYLADRAQHVDEVIRPGLASGHVILTDRYQDSSVVYQGICRGLGKKKVEDLNRLATGGLQPDLVFILDIPVSIARQRMKGRRLDRLEKEKRAFHDKVRRGFLTLAKSNSRRYKVVDASQSLEKVAEEIRMHTQRLLQRRRLWAH